MIPPSLVAAFSKPLVKYGAILGLILFTYLSYIGWKEYQQYIGRVEERDKQHLEQIQQAQEAAQAALKLKDDLLKKVQDVTQEKESIRLQLQKANQEIKRYVKLHRVRQIDPDAIAIVNEFARVLNDQTTDSLPPTTGTPAEPPVETKTAPTTLDAFERLEDLTGRLSACESDHRGLSEWAVESYQSQLHFYNRP